jgi:hypothetical protein
VLEARWLNSEGGWHTQSVMDVLGFHLLSAPDDDGSNLLIFQSRASAALARTDRPLGIHPWLPRIGRLIVYPLRLFPDPLTRRQDRVAASRPQRCIHFH